MLTVGEDVQVLIKLLDGGQTCNEGDLLARARILTYSSDEYGDS